MTPPLPPALHGNLAPAARHHMQLLADQLAREREQGSRTRPADEGPTTAPAPAPQRPRQPDEVPNFAGANLANLANLAANIEAAVDNLGLPTRNLPSVVPNAPLAATLPNRVTVETVSEDEDTSLSDAFSTISVRDGPLAGNHIPVGKSNNAGAA